jgi:hypothetical protein
MGGLLGALKTGNRMNVATGRAAASTLSAGAARIADILKGRLTPR